MVVKNKDTLDINPFDCLKPPFNMLNRGGVFPTSKSENTRWNTFRKLIAYFVFFLILVYNVQNYIYIYCNFDNFDKVSEAAFMTMTHSIFLFKSPVMFYYRDRILKINDVIKGPYFAPKCAYDKMLLVDQDKTMKRLFKVLMSTISISGTLWTVNPIINRYRGVPVVIPKYFPFEINSWYRFVFAAFWNAGFFLYWLAYCHISIDVIIANYFHQAKVQLQIIQRRFEEVFEGKPLPKGLSCSRFIDEVKPELKEKFLELKDHYDKVYWLMQEVMHIFQVPLVSQLMSTSAQMCLVIYCLTKGVSMERLVFLLLFAIVLQVQVFLYCYYGGMVEFESSAINDSIYLGNWLSLSPKFRKYLLIAMVRWSNPITPTVAGVIPLVLRTYISIIRMSYSLYTLIK